MARERENSKERKEAPKKVKERKHQKKWRNCKMLTRENTQERAQKEKGREILTQWAENDL